MTDVAEIQSVDNTNKKITMYKILFIILLTCFLSSFSSSTPWYINGAAISGGAFSFSIIKWIGHKIFFSNIV